MAYQVEISVFVPNLAQHTDENQPAQRVQNISTKKYTAITQAMLISMRKKEDLRIQLYSSDYNLCRALSPLLESTDWTINDSLDTLSDKFQAQLSKNKVVGLPDCFLPLQRRYCRGEQAEAAKLNLKLLQNLGVISDIGRSDEERLQIMAKVCGKLCFKNTYELPTGLDDTMLPDLLAKFTIMEVARKTD
ncbi:Glycoside hydrolase, clan GH-D [Cordyceps fumosorosea ARSEF 2679]|uniref:Glycoside hydrolase, clan GH-D n=1 Tax=Cordyceps fumosorosea (strain ARSEF 2679) TaxID=1081104 RepID=A0A166W9B8_CORFA|nr:Glycoside hydrolase, clan GH-D [Cordyceps fumosorosea ARSEF 2679]OAA34478.1 Glycoside hydrolase, clan GH-D [Cordyceps fumosorosea ARSEF 2679]